MTDRGRTTHVPARGKTRKKPGFHFSPTPSSPTPFGRSQIFWGAYFLQIWGGGWSELFSLAAVSFYKASLFKESLFKEYPCGSQGLSNPFHDNPQDPLSYKGVRVPPYMREMGAISQIGVLAWKPCTCWVQDGLIFGLFALRFQ